MKKPIVTIIVPVYKAEKYLSCCIDSILAQSFKDFELLLINDGSPDSSGQMCDEYASKDNRIHSFHKENGGVSSARNMGIDNAQGEWICFIDSDDWVEADFLKELIQYDSFDLIVGGLDSFGCAAISTKRNRNLVVDLKHSHQEAQILNADIGNTISTFYYSCGKLFRRSIISQNGLRFDTRMKMCEDTCFLMQYLTYADKIILSDSSSYRYRILFIVDKYAVDYECYKIHINLFDKYLSELECSLNNKMTILKKKIYTAILDKYLIRLKRIDRYPIFKKEVLAFNHDFTCALWKETDLAEIKKWVYRLIFRFPLLGYTLIRIIFWMKSKI